MLNLHNAGLFELGSMILAVLAAFRATLGSVAVTELVGFPPRPEDDPASDEVTQS